MLSLSIILDPKRKAGNLKTGKNDKAAYTALTLGKTFLIPSSQELWPGIGNREAEREVLDL
jgi:hypothetical protein